MDNKEKLQNRVRETMIKS